MRKRDIRECLPCHTIGIRQERDVWRNGCQQIVGSPLLFTMLMASGVRHLVPCNVLIRDARPTHGGAYTESLRRRDERLGSSAAAASHRALKAWSGS